MYLQAKAARRHPNHRIYKQKLSQGCFGAPPLQALGHEPKHACCCEDSSPHVFHDKRRPPNNRSWWGVQDPEFERTMNPPVINKPPPGEPIEAVRQGIATTSRELTAAYPRVNPATQKSPKAPLHTHAKTARRHPNHCICQQTLPQGTHIIVNTSMDCTKAPKS